MKKPLKNRTLNFIIDDVVHPQLKKYPELKLVDLLLHSIVEGDPVRSIGKTIRYDLPELMDAIYKKSTNRRRRRR